MVRSCSVDDVESCASCALEVGHLFRIGRSMIDVSRDGSWGGVDFLASNFEDHWGEANRICFDFGSDTAHNFGSVLRAVRLRDSGSLEVFVRGFERNLSYDLAIKADSVSDVRRDWL